MAETDKTRHRTITDTKFRTTRWSVTFFAKQFHLLESQPDWVKEWGYQDEVCPTTGTHHKQAYIETAQGRMSTMIKNLPGAHIEPIPSGPGPMTLEHPEGEYLHRWNKLKEYCCKGRTRMEGGETVTIKNENYVAHLSMEAALRLVAKERCEPSDEFKKLCNYKFDKIYAQEYWSSVTRILQTHSSAIGVFASPTMEKTWIRTCTYWIGSNP